jgi:hypothetical protein
MFDPNNPEQFEIVQTGEGPGIYMELPDLKYVNFSGEERNAHCMLIFPVETSLMAIASQSTGNNITRSAIVIPISQWETLRDAIDARIGFLREYAKKYREEKKHG